MAIGTTNFPTSLDTATELIRAVNDARTTISGSTNNSTTTINVTSAAAAPSDGIAVIVSAADDTVREIVSYTGKTGTSITGCTRGLESSGAKTWSAGDIVYFDVLTALSRTVLVNTLIALETKLGSGSDVAASGEFLRGSGAGASLWSAIQPGDIDDYLRVVVGSVAEGGATTLTNSSTSTWATHLSATEVLPAGTWECTTTLFGQYYGSTGNCDIEARVSLPAAGTLVRAAALQNVRALLAPYDQTSVVSDGVAATTFRGEYRRNAAAAPTINAASALIVAICRRTS